MNDPNNPPGGWQQQPPPPGEPPQPQGGGGWGQQPAAAQGGAIQPAPGGSYFADAKGQGYVPSEDEKQAAFFAHLFAAIACFLTGGILIPIAAPLVAWLMAKDKGPFASFHMHQAMIFQGVGFLINAVVAFVFSIIAFFTCGIGGILFVINLGIWLALCVYPIVVGLAAQKGEWSEYAMLGAKVMEMKSPIIK